MLEFTIPVKPRTKKNHNSLVTLKNGRSLMLPSKPYREFEKQVCDFIISNLVNFQTIDFPINLKCIFYKEAKRKSDLCGYLQAIQDALVKVGVLADDNHYIVESTDGSRVKYDKDNPRIEVCITKVGE